ncbi:Tyrosine-protein kinase sid-3 [Diplonema papillatum]|nr:Tyrosine-protein kinase sid-3 [Diplonema papillatum]
MLSLHADGCIHRDVAARNVFKEDGKYKLGDFGLVRSLEADTDVYQSLSEVPISWTAPEAIRTRSFSKPSCRPHPMSSPPNPPPPPATRAATQNTRTRGQRLCTPVIGLAGTLDL